MRRLTIPCKIGVLADTQVSNPTERDKFLAVVSRLFSSCDFIFHAGDIIYPTLLKDLGKIAPVWAVPGNEDDFGLYAKLPQKIDFQAGKFRLSLLHGHRPILIEAPNILANRIRHLLGRPPILKGLYRYLLKSCSVSDCIIFGHSHVSYLDIKNHTLLLNPGAFCFPQEMYNLPPSVAIINVKDLTISASIFNIDIDKGFYTKSKTKYFKRD